MHPFRHPTPIGVVDTWVDGAPAPDGLPSERSTGTWRTDDFDITLTGATPFYDGVDFNVGGHFAWLWRITVLRAVPHLQIVARLRPTAEVAAQPIQAPWLIGVKWQHDDIVAAMGTSDVDALMVRSVDGGWLPERFLDSADPTQPGQVPFLERNGLGITATYLAPREGEVFAHHVALAWAKRSNDNSVIEAVEVEADGILRGAELNQQ